MVENKLFFQVPRLNIRDLLNWQDVDQRNHRHQVHFNQKIKPRSETQCDLRTKCFGNEVTLNDEQIALFRIGDKVYGVQAKCPHAGGPLYLADIEELGPGQVCLKCPWHKWTFDIITGQCVIPGDRGVVARTYPVRVDHSGQIFVGFDSFGPSAFQMDW